MVTVPNTLRASPSCERNREPIGHVLKQWFSKATTLLEVGSGTGQHAAYLVDEFDHLRWQTTDLMPDTATIMGWAATAKRADDILPPVVLDASDAGHWQTLPVFDAILTVNTLHIMPWPQGVSMFRLAGLCSKAGTRFAIYGPFHRGGKPTGEGNAAFDHQLRAEGRGMGIRDLEAVRSTAARWGWLELAHYQMPANNQMLILERGPAEIVE